MEGCKVPHRSVATGRKERPGALTGGGEAGFVVLMWLLCGRSRLAALSMSEPGRVVQPVEPVSMGLVVPIFIESFAASAETDFEQ